MIRHHSAIPTRTDTAEELKGPAEDFRKFKAGNADLEVLINLFFLDFRVSARRCDESRKQFVVRWYDLYNRGIEASRLQELMKAEIQVSNSYDLLERDIQFKAKALADQRTAIGVINTAFSDLFKGPARKRQKP
jgi:hypothetical protein